MFIATESLVFIPGVSYRTQHPIFQKNFNLSHVMNTFISPQMRYLWIIYNVICSDINSSHSASVIREVDDTWIIIGIIAAS